MTNELQVFEQREILGQSLQMYGTKEEPLFLAKEVANWVEYDTTQLKKFLNNVDDTEKVRNSITTLGGIQETWFLTEDGLYEVLMQSRKPIAKEFKKEIKRILKEIRQTGSYIAPSKQAETIAVGKVMQNADRQMLEMIQGMVSKQIELQIENEKLQIELTHKEDVIIGLVDDIDLSTKRQRLNQIMKFNFKNGKHQADKWNLLYNEFERKYHVNLQQRMDRDNKTIKPKFKNKLDYIDRGMDMISQTYELACKIFENDVEKLKSQWFDTVSR
jgi:prophage antirepressor-like protein